MEPIQLGAIDQGWELTGTNTEVVTHRAEAQHHMQVASNLGSKSRSGDLAHTTEITTFSISSHGKVEKL